MKKRVFALLLSVCMLLCGCELLGKSEPPATEPPAQYDENTKLVYQLNQDGTAYAVVGIMDKNMEELVLPTEFNGKPVTRLSSLMIQSADDESQLGISIGGGTVTIIGANLKKLTISETIVELEISALRMHSGLDTLLVAPGNPAFSMSQDLLLSKDGKTLISAFLKKDVTELTIPDEITTLADGSIAISTLETLTLGKNVAAIEPKAFSGSNKLKTFVVPAENTHFMLRDEVLYSGDGKTLVCFPAGSDAVGYEVPEGVTTIAAGAYLGKLYTVVIPVSVTTVGAGAFAADGTGNLFGGSQAAGDLFVSGGSVDDNQIIVGAATITSIEYAGTIDQWEKIEKEEGWYPLFESDLFKMSISCSDGQVSNNGPEAPSEPTE